MEIDRRLLPAFEELQRQRREIHELHERAVETLQYGGGGGTSGGMGPWEQSVEGRLGELNVRLDNQLKWLLIAFAAGFLALAGLILNRTDALADKIDGARHEVAEVKAQVAALSAMTPSEAGTPPCPAGKPDCKPWEREWRSPPPVGTIIPK